MKEAVDGAREMETRESEFAENETNRRIERNEGDGGIEEDEERGKTK